MNNGIFKFKQVCLQVVSIILLTASMGSCNIYEQDDYKELVVVEAYLIANRPLPGIMISRTSPVDQTYVRDDLLLSGANLQVVLLDPSGDDFQIFSYSFNREQGKYLPDEPHYVQPKQRYRLDVQFNDRSEILRAYTTIPDQFEIINDIPETVIYQSSEQLELSITAPGRLDNQNVFVFSTRSLEPSIENLTPFYRASFDNENIDLSDVVINSSGLINEGNFEINPDGTITLRYPWIGVAFYGESEIIVQSVDSNLDKLIRSQQVQLGGSTLSPGEIPNITYNIEGGIGIFGSISSDTTRTNFLRQS